MFKNLFEVNKLFFSLIVKIITQTEQEEKDSIIILFIFGPFFPQDVNFNDIKRKCVYVFTIDA